MIWLEPYRAQHTNIYIYIYIYISNHLKNICNKMIIIKLITLFFIFFIYNSKIKRRDLNHGFKNQIESIKELKKDPIFG